MPKEQKLFKGERGQKKILLVKIYLPSPIKLDLPPPIKWDLPLMKKSWTRLCLLFMLLICTYT
jgi:hypothetical protein